MAERTRAGVLALCGVPLMVQGALLVGYESLPESIPLQFDGDGAVWSMPTMAAFIVTATVALGAYVALLALRADGSHRSALTVAGPTATIAPTIWCVGLVAAGGAVSAALTQVLGICALVLALLVGLLPRRLAR